MSLVSHYQSSPKRLLSRSTSEPPNPPPPPPLPIQGFESLHNESNGQDNEDFNLKPSDLIRRNSNSKLHNHNLFHDNFSICFFNI